MFDNLSERTLSEERASIKEMNNLPQDIIQNSTAVSKNINTSETET